MPLDSQQEKQLLDLINRAYDEDNSKRGDDRLALARVIYGTYRELLLVCARKKLKKAKRFIPGSNEQERNEYIHDLTLRFIDERILNPDQNILKHGIKDEGDLKGRLTNNLGYYIMDTLASEAEIIAGTEITSISTDHNRKHYKVTISNEDGTCINRKIPIDSKIIYRTDVDGNPVYNGKNEPLIEKIIVPKKLDLSTTAPIYMDNPDGGHSEENSAIHAAKSFDSEQYKEFGQGMDICKALEALKGLDQTDASIVQMSFWQEMTYKEIAYSINMTEDAVKQRMKRSLKKLRITMKVTDIYEGATR